MAILNSLFRRLLKLMFGMRSHNGPWTQPAKDVDEPSNKSPPTPLIFESELERIREETRAARTKDIETGGVLFGTRTPDDELLVYRATGPGPNADHHAAQFSPDTEHAQQLLDRLRTDRDVVWIGTWHKHPLHMDRLSNGDIVQMRDFVNDPDLLNEMVAIVVTNQGPTINISTFYMDEELSPVRTGFETVPESEEDRYRAYCRYDTSDRDEADEKTDSETSTNAGTATDGVDRTPLTGPSPDDTASLSDSSTETSRAAWTIGGPTNRPPEDTERPVESDEPISGTGTDWQERVVEEYKSLQSSETVRDVTLRRSDSDDEALFIIRAVPRDSSPIVFICSEGFPRDPPVVALEGTDSYEPLEEYPKQWSPERSFIDIVINVTGSGSWYYS